MADPIPDGSQTPQEIADEALENTTESPEERLERADGVLDECDRFIHHQVRTHRGSVVDRGGYDMLAFPLAENKVVVLMSYQPEDNTRIGTAELDRWHDDFARLKGLGSDPGVRISAAEKVTRFRELIQGEPLSKNDAWAAFVRRDEAIEKYRDSVNEVVRVARTEQRNSPDYQAAKTEFERLEVEATPLITQRDELQKKIDELNAQMSATREKAKASVEEAAKLARDKFDEDYLGEPTA